MRLLRYDSTGRLGLAKIIHARNQIPPYAILSHTWGSDADEVTLQDLVDGTGQDKPGYRKIHFCGQQAIRDGIQYFWVDTCCIDKKNSASELDEAINSMFRWYRESAKCYVYLSDISTNKCVQTGDPFLQPWQQAFRESRWFKRGWTLQELIAPRTVEFYCSDGRKLGDRTSLEGLLHEITGVAVEALRGTRDATTFSEEERLSWIESRRTTMEEDKIYSLLGIFDVRLPLYYGEGEAEALERLLDAAHRKHTKRHRDELSLLEADKRAKISANFSSPIASSSGPSIIHQPPPRSSAHSAQSVDETKQSLIAQLYFDKIDERVTSLSAAQQGTCGWFHLKPEYTAWQKAGQEAEHGCFLWIKGNPGTGKSTIMKYLFEKAMITSKRQSSQIIISFFFLARGAIEEKSTAGLYRSLLHQLFQKAVESQEGLDWMTSDGAALIQVNGWSEEALKQTLSHAVQKLRHRALTIFVDALDECRQDEAWSMISFFENLCNCAREAQVQLKICFSSRYYPTLSIDRAIEVRLEDETGHSEDIENYINSNFRLGKSKQAESLRSDILNKSSGIFLWVVLVIDILNSECIGNTISLKKIGQRLQEIPPKLADLFKMILERDEKNVDELRICLKWILFATRALKPQELYFAVQVELDAESSGYWDHDDIASDQMEVWVRSVSKGMAEVTRKTLDVLFIHESVRDFLLGKYESQWSGRCDNFLGSSHEVMRNSCLAQLNASISKYVEIPDPLRSAKDALLLRDAISSTFPFLEYSVFNILHHADRAQENAIAQQAFLDTFPLQRWVALRNALVKHGTQRYTTSVSLTYIFAEMDLANLIRIHPQSTSCFDVEEERYGAPILAARVAESHQAIKAFLEVQSEVLPGKIRLRDICQRYSGNRNAGAKMSRNFNFSQETRALWSYFLEYGDEVVLIFLYALGRVDSRSKDKKDRTLLSWAAGNNYEGLLALLLDEGIGLGAKDLSGWTPLSWAAKNGHESAVIQLLGKGAELEVKDLSGQTALSLAVKNGHEEVVRCLLERGAMIDTRDTIEQTSLFWAAGNNHETITELLLQRGAELEAKDSSYRTALMWAFVKGHEATVSCLLKNGAMIDTRDDSGRTPLSLAASRHTGEYDVEFLLDNNSEVDTRDRFGRTPLSRAAYEGKSCSIMKSLLEKGADVNSKDTFGRTPLSWACFEDRLINVAVIGWTPLHHVAFYGFWEFMRILLKYGAEPETKDNSGRTPLSRLASTCNSGSEIDYMIEVLLAHGAELEGRDNSGRTPLSWTAYGRSTEVIEYLLRKGADLEAKDNTGRTPLSWAASGDYCQTVKLLLDHGAEIEVKDNSGQTPLSWATHPDIKGLLLKHGVK